MTQPPRTSGSLGYGPCILLLLAIIALSGNRVDARLPWLDDGKGEPPTLAPMLNRVTPAVVNISTEGRIKLQQNPLFSDPFFRRFFNIPEQQLERRTQSLGSGVIVDAQQGLVLTNSHVIANALQITVSMLDGRQFQAELVGSDPETDIAVIRIPAENLTAIRPADSDKLRVGDFVVAIGNPFSLEHTVTSGIVSALGRSGLGIEGYEDFIQTDAAINPGNSGGALVNLRGELMGINTAIFSRTGGNIGIGFAIPINLALYVVEQLQKTGRVERGFLGALTQDLNPDLAKAFGVDAQQGAVIVRLLEDSPAANAGLRAGDIIVAVEGKPIKNSLALRNRIGLLPVGEKVRFRILRNGVLRTLTVVIGEKTAAKHGGDLKKPNLVNRLLDGVRVGDIGEGNPLYGKIEGVVIVSLPKNGPAWQGKLRPGDIVTSVNGTLVRNLKEFLREVGGKEDYLLFRIVRGNNAAFIVIK